jgi:hypothetical protein
MLCGQVEWIRFPASDIAMKETLRSPVLSHKASQWIDSTPQLASLSNGRIQTTSARTFGCKSGGKFTGHQRASYQINLKFGDAWKQVGSGDGLKKPVLPGRAFFTKNLRLGVNPGSSSITLHCLSQPVYLAKR